MVEAVVTMMPDTLQDTTARCCNGAAYFQSLVGRQRDPGCFCCLQLPRVLGNILVMKGPRMKSPHLIDAVRSCSVCVPTLQSMSCVAWDFTGIAFRS